MYHSLIGKPSLRVVLVMGLLMGLCSLLLLAACGGEEAAKGAAGQEHVAAGAVEDEVPVILHLQISAGVPRRLRQPDWQSPGVQHHQIAVALHEQDVATVG